MNYRILILLFLILIISGCKTASLTNLLETQEDRNYKNTIILLESKQRLVLNTKNKRELISVSEVDRIKQIKKDITEGTYRINCRPHSCRSDLLSELRDYISNVGYKKISFFLQESIREVIALPKTNGTLKKFNELNRELESMFSVRMSDDKQGYWRKVVDLPRVRNSAEKYVRLYDELEEQVVNRPKFAKFERECNAITKKMKLLPNYSDYEISAKLSDSPMGWKVKHYICSLSKKGHNVSIHSNAKTIMLVINKTVSVTFAIDRNSRVWNITKAASGSKLVISNKKDLHNLLVALFLAVKS